MTPRSRVSRAPIKPYSSFGAGTSATPMALARMPPSMRPWVCCRRGCRTVTVRAALPRKALETARRMTKAYGQWPRPGTRSPHASPCAAVASAAAISLTRRRAGTALGLRRAGWAGWCSQQSAAPLSRGKRTPPWRSLLSYLSLELESRERETLKRSDSTLKYLVFYNGFFDKNKTKSALPTRATD